MTYLLVIGSRHIREEQELQTVVVMVMSSLRFGFGGSMLLGGVTRHRIRTVCTLQQENCLYTLATNSAVRLCGRLKKAPLAIVGVSTGVVLYLGGGLGVESSESSRLGLRF